VPHRCSDTPCPLPTARFNRPKVSFRCTELLFADVAAQIHLVRANGLTWNMSADVLCEEAMKHDQLRSIGHNLADSLASGSSLLFQIFGPDLFHAVRETPERCIVVDLLAGVVTAGRVPPSWDRVIARSPDALAHLCNKHGASPGMFFELTAHYSVGRLSECRTVLALTDNQGRRSQDTYVGMPGRRVMTRDDLGRLRRNRRSVGSSEPVR
jgi:hypothetical protein